MKDFALSVESIRAKLGDLSTSGIKRKYFLSREVFVNFLDSPATQLLDTIDQVFLRHNAIIVQRRMSLETLVELGTHFETTDHRDAIYALLNLANDVDSLSQSDPSIAPDYDRSILDVFTDFILHCCRRSGSLNIICRPWAPVWSCPLYVMTQTPRSDRIESMDIPSWIACRDALPFGNPSRRMTYRIHGRPLVANAQKRTYNAHDGTKPQVRTGRNHRTQGCDGALYAKGIILGTITETSTRMANAIITQDCISILKTRTEDESETSCELPDCLWRTFCADRDYVGDPAPSSFEQAMVQTLQLCAKDQVASSPVDLVDTIASIDVEDILTTQEVTDPVRNFLETIRDVIWNRRTFRGKRDHFLGSDIIGLVPRHTQVHDQVCILYGCSVPVVLRKESGKNGAMYWRLIGEAYVHGAMDGEEISSSPPVMLKSMEEEFESR